MQKPTDLIDDMSLPPYRLPLRNESYGGSAMTYVFKKAFPGDYPQFINQGGVQQASYYETEHAIIFPPCSDKADSQLESIDAILKQNYFHLKPRLEALKNKRWLFSVAEEQNFLGKPRNHWVTVCYEPTGYGPTKTEGKITLIDSTGAGSGLHLLSKQFSEYMGNLLKFFEQQAKTHLYSTDSMQNMFITGLAPYSLKSKSIDIVYKEVQIDDIHCGRWTAIILMSLAFGKDPILSIDDLPDILTHFENFDQVAFAPYVTVKEREDAINAITASEITAEEMHHNTTETSTRLEPDITAEEEHRDVANALTRPITDVIDREAHNNETDVTTEFMSGITLEEGRSIVTHEMASAMNHSTTISFQRLNSNDSLSDVATHDTEQTYGSTIKFLKNALFSKLFGHYNLPLYLSPGLSRTHQPLGLLSNIPHHFSQYPQQKTPIFYAPPRVSPSIFQFIFRQPISNTSRTRSLLNNVDSQKISLVKEERIDKHKPIPVQEKRQSTPALEELTDQPQTMLEQKERTEKPQVTHVQNKLTNESKPMSEIERLATNNLPFSPDSIERPSRSGAFETVASLTRGTQLSLFPTNTEKTLETINKTPISHNNFSNHFQLRCLQALLITSAITFTILAVLMAPSVAIIGIGTTAGLMIALCYSAIGSAFVTGLSAAALEVSDVYRQQKVKSAPQFETSSFV